MSSYSKRKIIIFCRSIVLWVFLLRNTEWNQTVDFNQTIRLRTRQLADSEVSLGRYSLKATIKSRRWRGSENSGCECVAWQLGTFGRGSCVKNGSERLFFKTDGVWCACVSLPRPAIGSLHTMRFLWCGTIHVTPTSSGLYSSQQWRSATHVASYEHHCPASLCHGWGTSGAASWEAGPGGLLSQCPVSKWHLSRSPLSPAEFTGSLALPHRDAYGLQ